jgi:hypothetical protein
LDAEFAVLEYPQPEDPKVKPVVESAKLRAEDDNPDTDE